MTNALATFHRLIDQVDHIEQVASSVEEDNPIASPVLRRSAYVLAVAALDTFFHEHGAVRLAQSAKQGTPHDVRVANYLGSASPADVAGAYGPSHVRLHLGFKTLVAPSKIDGLVAAWGGDPSALWLNYCFAVGSRPDRERRRLELLYDRRNQIAHEGDWDVVQLQFRHMAKAHLADCVDFVTSIAEEFDQLM